MGAWAVARKRIAALGIEFEEHVTSRAGEATDATREALLAGTTHIVAVGGDGTLNEVVNGYLNDTGSAINNAASIALLPSGTGSDFRRSLGLTSQSSSLRTLIESETRLVDAGRAEFKDLNGADGSRFFINIASFGLGGDVSEMVNRWSGRLPRWIGGRARFGTAAIAALGRYKNVAVSLRLDEREMRISSNLIVVANGRFAGGGMMLAPHAEVDDGMFDVIVTDGATRFDVIKELPRIQRGSHLKNPKVKEMRSGQVSIDSEEPMAIDLDGEMVGWTPAVLKVLPSTIRFRG